MTTTPPLAHLIEELKKIPGIGRKSAQRIAFYLLQDRQEERPGPGGSHRPGPGKDRLLFDLQQHHAPSTLRDLFQRGTRRRKNLRGRGTLQYLFH